MKYNSEQKVEDNIRQSVFWYPPCCTHALPSWSYIMWACVASNDVCRVCGKASYWSGWLIRVVVSLDLSVGN